MLCLQRRHNSSWGKTVTKHLANIEEIFCKLEKANLRVNLDKTEFLKSETEVLGYIITSEGINPDERKIAAVKNMKPPTNLKVYGLVSYYCRLVRDFAKIDKPPTSLIRGDNGQVKLCQSKKNYL